MLSEQGKPEDAFAMYEKSLNIKVKVFGPDHPSTAATQNNIGIVLKNQGRYPEVLKMYNMCLKTHEKVLGLNHPLVADTKNK